MMQAHTSEVLTGMISPYSSFHQLSHVVSVESVAFLK